MLAWPVMLRVAAGGSAETALLELKQLGAPSNWCNAGSMLLLLMVLQVSDNA